MIGTIASGRTDLVFEYLERGNSATANDADGVSLIQWCAYYGDVSAVRCLLAKGETLESLGLNYDLNGACFHGHWRLVEFLVEGGADVNRPLPDTGESPLHAALCKPNRRQFDHVVRILLDHGAHPDAATIPGVETGCFMRDVRTRGETPLHRAAAYGSEELIRLLIAAGAKRDVKDAHGDSPLSWASMHLRSDAVLRLLCYGPYQIHPDRNYPGDRGDGWSGIDDSLLGHPLSR